MCKLIKCAYFVLVHRYFAFRVLYWKIYKQEIFAICSRKLFSKVFRRFNHLQLGVYNCKEPVSKSVSNRTIYFKQIFLLLTSLLHVISFFAFYLIPNWPSFCGRCKGQSSRKLVVFPYPRKKRKRTPTFLPFVGEGKCPTDTRSATLRHAAPRWYHVTSRRSSPRRTRL